MKRFLVFGVKSFTDMFGGARGYIGKFNTVEELKELIERKKEWIFEERIEEFNFIDLNTDKIITNNEGCEDWDLFSELTWHYKVFEFNEDVFIELNDILEMTSNPITYFTKKEMEKK